MVKAALAAGADVEVKHRVRRWRGWGEWGQGEGWEGTAGSIMCMQKLWMMLFDVYRYVLRAGPLLQAG